MEGEGRGRNFDRLLRPKSIAVIGGRQAKAVVEQCIALGFAGEIWPVHPSKQEICGLKAYKTIEALPSSPDAAFIGINRQHTVAIVEALRRRNAGGAICYASGFSETGSTGADLQCALVTAAGHMPIIGPNCYGLLNYADGVALWPDQHGGGRLAAGQKGVAILTQSSNIAINMTMQKRGLPVSYVLTAGNQAQTGLSEIALSLLEDERVSALGLHIEGFDSISGFEAVAKRARALKKPVVAMKIGRSLQARHASFTHTASLAGSDAAAEAFLKRLGIARVKTIPTFLETLKLLHVTGPLGGFSISSMSCSGGEASLMADACFGRKVFFPPLPAAQKRPIEAQLGALVTVDNPLDYHTYIWGNRDRLETTFTGMLNAGFDFNCLVLDFPRPDRCSAQDWWITVDAFETACRKTGAKSAIVSTLPENLSEDQASDLIARNIAPMCGIDETLEAIEAAATIGQAWAKPSPAAVMASSRVNCSNNHVPDEAEAKILLSRCGIKIPTGQKLRGTDEIAAAVEKIGFPVVLKALGIAHKSEHNAVRLNLGDIKAVRKATAELKELSEEIYVEAMIEHGVVELLVGLVRDDQFGLVMTIATGGTMVEVLQDSQTMLLPSNDEEIEQALRALKGSVFFDGFRGSDKADLPAAIATIKAVQEFAALNAGQLSELDINPLIVCAHGCGAVAADALIKFGSGNNE